MARNSRHSPFSCQLHKVENIPEKPIYDSAGLNLDSLAPNIRSRPKSSHDIRSTLSPSPLFVENFKRSMDDINIALSPTTPFTPKKPPALTHGLSLQMPPRDISSTSIANLTKPVPLSPRLDRSTSFASSSVLPRRSRGLDFSRACTNLHHSTLAEQSSPDSSPIIGSRGVSIPARKGLYNSLSAANFPESPGSTSHSLWSQIQHPDKTLTSSSMGSINMMDFDSGSSSTDDDHLMEHIEDEDAISMASSVNQTGNGPSNFFSSMKISSPSADFIRLAPPAAKLLSFQRARLRRGRSRKISGNSSGHSSMHSAGSGSPPLAKSIEGNLGIGYSPRESSKTYVSSRRESLSLGTNNLQLTDGEDSGEGGLSQHNPDDDPGASAPPILARDEKSNVIRRVVTRRTNMLVRVPQADKLQSFGFFSSKNADVVIQPQTRVFARIKAALQEESAPVDTEVRKEAEVVRQVRGSDGNDGICHIPSRAPTAASSPVLVATGPTQTDTFEYNVEDLLMSGEASTSRRSSSSTFTSQAARNSGGPCFWHAFEERTRTPPISIPRGSSSEDTSMDTPLSSIQSSMLQLEPLKSRQFLGSRSSTPQPLTGLVDSTRKGNKRMRDDDFDPNFFKRRAVSPGMSLQNSPILPQSPLQRESGWWGNQSKSARETPSVQVRGERVGSGGSVSSTSTSVVPSKRVGMQGMNDTNDGLMNMSIE